MGDGVLIYFGYPRAHEDDAERAVRAGLGVIEAVGRLDVKSGKLQARVGIATGLVVVGDLIGEGSAQEQRSSAKRLISPPGCKPWPSRTPSLSPRARVGWSAICSSFAIRNREVKGFAAPVPAWQVLRPSAVASRFEALRGAALTPLVGRDEEIDLLLRRWEQAKAGEGQVVLVSGEAGIGKSRLTAALEERIARRAAHAPALFLLALSPGQRAVTVHRPARTRGRVRARRSARCRTGEARSRAGPRRAAGRGCGAPCRSAVVAGSERYQLPNLSPQRKKERTLEALIRQLEGLARQQPVVMVFEDAHWIDPTSRELLDLTVERVRSLPVLLIITFRPEFQPPWTGQPHVNMLMLNRLGRRDRHCAGEQIAGGKALPERSSTRSSSAPTACRCLSRS